jgi:hypothetical protein
MADDNKNTPPKETPPPVPKENITKTSKLKEVRNLDFGKEKSKPKK